jgi:hypothetical protein
MSARLRTHIRSNIIGYVALFFALSTGSAVALSGSNTVFTDDIANDTQPASGGNPAGGLVAADLRPNSVGTSEVAADSLGAGDLAPSSVGTSEVVNNSLTGTDVNEATLGQVPSAALGGTGRSASDASCDPQTTAFETCVATSVTVETSQISRVLVTAAVSMHTASTPESSGICRLSTPDGVIPGSSRTLSIPSGAGPSGFSLVAVTQVSLPAGLALPFTLDCNQEGGDIAYSDEQISAVALSPN